MIVNMFSGKFLLFLRELKLPEQILPVMGAGRSAQGGSGSEGGERKWNFL